MVRVYDTERRERTILMNTKTPNIYNCHMFPAHLCSRASYKRVIETWEQLGYNFAQLVEIQARGYSTAPVQKRVDFLRYVLMRAETHTNFTRIYELTFLLASNWCVMCLLRVNSDFPRFYKYLIDCVPYFESFYPSYARKQTLDTMARKAYFSVHSNVILIKHIQATTHPAQLKVNTSFYWITFEQAFPEYASDAVLEFTITKPCKITSDVSIVQHNLFKIYGSILRQLNLPDEIIIQILQYFKFNRSCVASHTQRYSFMPYNLVRSCIHEHNCAASIKMTALWLFNSRKHISSKCKYTCHNG